MIFSKRYLLIFTLLFAATATELLAQKKNNRRPAVTPKPLVGSSETPNASPEPTPALKNAAKKNERPDSNAGDQDTKHNSSRLTSESLAPYIYEFSQPSFIVSKIVISHGDDGKGTIAFKRAGHEEMFSDPLEVSTAAMRRIDAVLDALDFVNSSENYQYEKDYAHLGTASMTIRKNGKTRTARYNYTTNKDAKTLADEYRRLSNQYIWIFDITVARKNQPLNAPILLEMLDSFFKRNEISDREQMKPILLSLSNDEG
ncbi:MAG: hypothetical protein LC730_04885, partial [Acidobacteria bacterium]|nr:hypothetical protein [Acidobacteriota bacterium]